MTISNEEARKKALERQYDNESKARQRLRLHSEDAERRVPLDGLVERGGKADAENVTRIDWVDDTIVPKSCARIVRMPFVLILGLDGSLSWMRGYR